VKSKSTTRVRSAASHRPPDVDWGTTGSRNEIKPQSRAISKPRAPKSRAPPKQRVSPAGTPPRPVNDPLVESESWPGIGRLSGRRKTTAVRGVWAVRSFASPEVKTQRPRPRGKTTKSWGASRSQAPTAANVLKGEHKPAKASGAGSWNGIPVKFKSKKKRKK